ncbi:hypothetical protein B0J11DRAFT_436450 [Dendryphion nanum]|uniref:Uncharacterized protein n=1 Tax=Dendryphion nanum TaxID=256645 RepID=A0A9P9DQN2_9PLEO|nr:hypothetical protein B0J11DRAFT_436450 [Dendryphion nanum]
MSDTTFPLLQLPRELRDQIYDYVFSMPDPRSDRALRIERRNVKHFTPSAATILLICHHDYLILNRQIASEALEVLFKRHSILLSCGPFILKRLLSMIENEDSGQGKQWLKWMKRIELDWVTFPNLRMYPPNREHGKDEWHWENDTFEIDIDNIRGAQYSGHYDEYDYEGEAYDDNIYSPDDPSLYPAFFEQSPDPADPFGFSTHYPFSDPEQEVNEDGEVQEDGETPDDVMDSKLDLLVDIEVAPLFGYLSTPTFTLSNITIPLYFISKQTYYQRYVSRHGHTLPVKVRYWIHVAVHALNMLLQPSPDGSYALDQVTIKYKPWDIWACMDPSDDLSRMKETGVWFDEEGAELSSEGAAFRSIWVHLAEEGIVSPRQDLVADISYVMWEGDLDQFSVGDQLDVVFRRA